MAIITTNRAQTSEADVLGLLVDHLRARFGIGESNCFDVIEPVTKRLNQSGDFWLTVYPGGSEADLETQTGGGRNVIWEMCDFVITAYTRIKLDRTNPDTKMLRDPTRGILSIKQRVMSAMTMAELSVDLSSVLIQPPLYIGSDRAFFDKDESVASKSLTFRLGFSNRLTAEGARA